MWWFIHLSFILSAAVSSKLSLNCSRADLLWHNSPSFPSQSWSWTFPMAMHFQAFSLTDVTEFTVGQHQPFQLQLLHLKKKFFMEPEAWFMPGKWRFSNQQNSFNPTSDLHNDCVNRQGRKMGIYHTTCSTEGGCENRASVSSVSICKCLWVPSSDFDLLTINTVSISSTDKDLSIL